MTVEYIDENGVWQCPDHKPSHGRDCEVLNLADDEVVGVKFWAKPPPPANKAQERKCGS